MTAFVVLAVFMSAAAAALVARGLLGRGPGAQRVSRRAANREIHAAELEALDAELACGRVTVDAHRAARDELLRRLLAESEDPRPVARGKASRLPGLALALAAPLVAILLYLVVGNPAALAGRETADQAAQLQAHLARAPGDGRAWIALARLHMEAARYGEATRAYERAIEGVPKIAADPQVWCELADALAMAQGGRLAGRPRDMIARALALSPAHPQALEMAGSAAFEAGEYDTTVARWTELLAQLPLQSEQARELNAALARVQAMAAARR